MRCDLIFESNRFNLSLVRPYFINPCCFGEDLAAWLSEQLDAQGIQTTTPEQEDWGWYVLASMDGTQYFLGIGGNSNEDPNDRNYGEWRIMIEKQRSFWQKLTGKNDLSRTERIFSVLEELLAQKLGVPSFRYEEAK